MPINPNVVVPESSKMVSPPQGGGILAGTCLTTNPLMTTTQPVMQFTNADDVGDYFGTTSNEYEQAVIYFTGTDQATTLPLYMYFAQYTAVAAAPFIRSQPVTNAVTLLASLVAITAGTLTFQNDGAPITTSGISLSTATSLSMAASLLQAAIIKANPTPSSLTVEYNGVLNFFQISNGVTGSISSMGFATATPLATLLGWTNASGAYLSQGTGVMTPAQNMSFLQDYLLDTFNIWAVDNLGDETEATNLAIAEWVSTVGANTYAFLAWDNEVALTLANDTTSLQYQITQLGYVNTAVVYNSPIYCALIASAFAASVDAFGNYVGITACFKSQAGLPYSVDTTAVAQAMIAKGVNFYGNYSLATAGYSFLQPGAISGSYLFIDNLAAAVWIGRNVQLNLFNLLTTVGQVSNDTQGYGEIDGQINNVMALAIPNKLVVVGQSFSQSTANQILTKYGVPISTITNNGYAIAQTPSSEAQRAARTTPPWYLIYCKDSAIQVIPVNVVGLF